MRHRVNVTLQHAVKVLRAGGVVLHATEGVWGLACDPWQSAAVEKILALKKRSANKGLIVIGASAEAFRQQLGHADAEHRSRVIASWPGHHTWIFADSAYPPIIRGYGDTLACRVPAHDQARALCLAFGGTLVSTSANRTGEPANTSPARVRSDLAAQVDYCLAGTVGEAGRASVIHGLDGEILR